jgi:hypothetical protein
MKVTDLELSQAKLDYSNRVLAGISSNEQLADFLGAVFAESKSPAWLDPKQAIGELRAAADRGAGAAGRTCTQR